jgi:hypothetical protein
MRTLIEVATLRVSAACIIQLSSKVPRAALIPPLASTVCGSPFLFLLIMRTVAIVAGLPKTALALDCSKNPIDPRCVSRIIQAFTVPGGCPPCGTVELPPHFLDRIISPGGDITPSGHGESNLAIFVHTGVHGYVTSITAGNNQTVVRTLSLPLLMNQSSTK